MKLIIILLGLIVIQLIVIFLKDRFLQFLSIIFGLIALSPIIFSIGLYFGEAPVVEYEIFGKNSIREGNNYTYDFDISIFSKKSMILRDEGIAINELIEGTSSIGLHPKYAGRLKVLGTREGNFFVGDNEERYFEKRVQYTSGYRIIAEKEKDKIYVKYLINSRIDIARLGVFGIFNPNYEYRLVATIPIDFKNQNIQKGYFKRVD